jgi:hypothetical protein
MAKQHRLLHNKHNSLKILIISNLFIVLMNIILYFYLYIVKSNLNELPRGRAIEVSSGKNLFLVL